MSRPLLVATLGRSHPRLCHDYVIFRGCDLIARRWLRDVFDDVSLRTEDDGAPVITDEAHVLLDWRWRTSRTRRFDPQR